MDNLATDKDQFLKVVDDRDDPDSERVSVYSDAVSEFTIQTVDTTNPTGDFDKKSHNRPRKEPESPFDLLGKVEGMYRLLDLIPEQGSGGAVEKIIIAQDSIAKWANDIHPRSYKSMTKVDFHALDKHTIRPLGVYGSIVSIADFLLKLGRVDDETRELLIKPRDESSGVTTPTLRPGMYILDARSIEPDRFYVIFWPEDATWQDGEASAAARNRITFMRYLTKLCDQFVCLISDEHSDKLIWQDDENDTPNADLDVGDNDLYDRLFTFSVKQTNDEEESATAQEGFMVKSRIIDGPNVRHIDYPDEFPLDALQPRLVVGEQSQAVLHVEYIPEEVVDESVEWEYKRGVLEEKLKEANTPYILLHDNIDRQSLEHLLQLKLGLRCGDLVPRWEYQRQGDQKMREKQKKDRRGAAEKKLETDLKSLGNALPFWLARLTHQYFESISEETLMIAVLGDQDKTIDADDVESAIDEVEAFLSKYPAMKARLTTPIRKDLSSLDPDRSSRYNALKRQFRQVAMTIDDHKELSDQQVQALLDLIRARKDFTSSFNKLITSRGTQEMQPSIWSGTWSDMAKRFVGTDWPALNNNLPSLDYMDDITFMKNLSAIVTTYPGYGDAAAEIKAEAFKALKKKMDRIGNTWITTIKDTMLEMIEADINREFLNRQKLEEENAWESLRVNLQKALLAAPNNSKTCLLIRSVKREISRWGMSKQDSFRLKGTWSQPNDSGFEYALHSMDIKADDLQKVSTDSSHVCTPFFRKEPSAKFILPLPTSLKYIRLIGRDHVLIVIEDDTSLRIFLDTVNTVAASIAADRHKKRFYFDKIGRKHLFTVDETKRLFALVTSHSDAINIHVYIYDQDVRTFNARGGAINITRWFPRGIPEFSGVTFVAGTEELLLVDHTGFSRLFYLTTETFRPATLQLGSAPISISSSSDGACLFAFDSEEGKTRLRCFHWASLGQTHGYNIPLPPVVTASTPLAVSSVGHRNSAHVIFLDKRSHTCASLSMRITRKSTEFEFTSSDNYGERQNIRNTINNVLIDCHAEVWTRFPIQAAIQREHTTATKHSQRSITFVSSASSDRFAPYFSSMIHEFERKTRKPTRGILARIKVSATEQWEPITQEQDISAFQTGDWLVGLFCLIPIHLAVTGANRFKPLKDGVISPAFEQSLLGVSVAEIAEAISFGWYESIFNSYLASKPVKVVTSMGEQSVGKSYALNHFVDTSFAGSAMRCTEGVWLSVTPTRDVLFVAMDFEGVHSIERSAQEDTLLVLLNTAISNFVLFRNNFALSRDIAELFTSFQSCTTILDPASNPSLFQSNLVIIVKDVISQDAREIKNEFKQKFAAIVQREGAQNFITKLHKGQLDIIPWPVIESSQFYGLFELLKDRLIKRPTTHNHAVQFFDILKTLMAKLKANDWGALDQNLAVQRAEFLSSMLVPALAFGTSDPATGEPLRNCDTDELFEDGKTEDIFYVSTALDPASREVLLPEQCLYDLRRGWSDRFSRFELSEEEFLERYNAYLQGLADIRIQYVRNWLRENTRRFGDKTEITSVVRRFEGLSKELKAAIMLCGISCSSCGLLCIEQKYHNGRHDCKTSHQCYKLCEFEKQHEDAVPQCDMPAGHSGRHVCKTLPHLCGAPCDMSDKDGCMQFCSRPMEHEEMEHLCPARTHACGEPCSLITEDGTPLCVRKCVIDSRLPHERHCCERPLECIEKCQLCSSRCAAGDHFHAIEEGAVHLCGQEHVCPHRCESAGICEIATTPQKIESVFVGRHNTFQYTKYTQEARRLPCIVTLDPTALGHDGPHIHSTDRHAFHYCEERCEYCGYYCTLPLGHPQKEHDTSHGSMEQTEWLVDGDKALELDGRKYATGDSGAPMLCNLLCKTMGRHVHVADCRAEDPHDCSEEGVDHIWRRGADKEQDWITHRLFWARSGFKDPYTNTEQHEFDLCDRRCSGEEHNAAVNPGALPSMCLLPLFHPPARPEDAPLLGYVSQDGHVYNCKNPSVMKRSFHIFFALDCSGSMRLDDCRPLADTPASVRIAAHADNRFGAALSSVYGFWLAREGAQRPGAGGAHKDAYTVVAFDHEARVVCSNDTHSAADELLALLPNNATEDGGTNFTDTLILLQRELENTWSTERYPVVIFLSDGERTFEEVAAYDLCRAAVRLGKPLAFHAVSFGEDGGTVHLQRMTTIARDTFEAAPADPLIPAGTNPCSFSEALDTVQLANAYLSIADSLGNPRAALKRV